MSGDLDLTGLQPLDTSGFDSLDTEGLTRLDTTGFQPVARPRRDFDIDTMGSRTRGSEPGRLRTATSQFVRGLGSIISGGPKGAAMLDAPDTGVWRNLDRIDRGEAYIPRPSMASMVPGGQGFYWQDQWREFDYYKDYANASPAQRAEARQEIIDAYQRVLDSDLWKMGEDIDQWFSQNFRINQEYEDEFWSSKVPNALGSATGFVTAAMLTRGMFGSSALPTYGSPALLGSTVNRVDVFEDALNEGADFTTAFEAADWGGVVGLTEAVPIGNLFNRLDKGSGGQVRQWISRMIRQGTEEAVQETFAGVMNAAIAQNMYDPDRGIWTMDRVEEGAVGFTTGALLESLFTLALPGRRRGVTTTNADGTTTTTPDDFTFTEAQIITAANQRLAALESAENLSPIEQQELDMLREHVGNPVRLAQEYGVALSPEGVREQANQVPVEITEADEASPLETDLIQEGKETIRDGQGVEAANSILREAGFPEVGTTIEIIDGDQKRVAEVIDAYDQNGEQGVILRRPNGMQEVASFETLSGRVTPLEEGDAEAVRDDEAEVQEAGAGEPGRQDEGRTDLQQPAEAGPEAGDTVQGPEAGRALEPAEEIRPLTELENQVTGAIERGEAEPIVELPVEEGVTEEARTAWAGELSRPGREDLLRHTYRDMTDADYARISEIAWEDLSSRNRQEISAALPTFEVGGVALYAEPREPAESAEQREELSETDALIQERGRQVTSRIDAERAWADGDRVFAQSEQDGEFSEVSSMEMLGNYTPDQLVAVAVPDSQPREIDLKEPETEGYTLHERFHEKREKDIFIVEPSERVDRDTFKEIRARAKAAGGWYSRKWRDSPGGFAFETREAAEAFARAEFGQEPAAEPEAAQAPTELSLDELRTRLDEMDRMIDSQMIVDARLVDKADQLRRTIREREEAEAAPAAGPKVIINELNMDELRAEQAAEDDGIPRPSAEEVERRQQERDERAARRAQEIETLGEQLRGEGVDLVGGRAVPAAPRRVDEPPANLDGAMAEMWTQKFDEFVAAERTTRAEAQAQADEYVRPIQELADTSGEEVVAWIDDDYDWMYARASEATAVLEDEVQFRVQPSGQVAPTTSIDNDADALTQAFADLFEGGGSFTTITAARNFAGKQIGRKIEAGTPEAKMVDEAIEKGMILAASAIVEDGKGLAPRKTYDQLVDLYQRMPKLGTRTSTSVEQQAYSTPVPLAYLASQLAGITANSTVYEPSAGNGALLLTADPDKVVANELNEDRARFLRALLPGGTVTVNDAAEVVPEQDFDVIIANPPFGVVKDDAGKSKTWQIDEQYETREIDHAISMKALDAMLPEGSGVLIVGSVAKTAKTEQARSDAYNSKSKREFYLKLYQQYNVVDHFTVPGELYERQGAGWPVDVIVIRGRAKSQRQVPAVSVPQVYRSWEDLANVLETQYPQAPEGTRASARARAPEEPGPARSDEGDGRPGRESRPDREPDAVASDDTTGVREGPVAGQPSDTGPSEPARTEPAEPAPSERPEQRARRAPVAPDKRQVPYQPSSKARPMDTLVPVNMQTAVDDALLKLRQRHGDLDAYVAQELGYDPDKLADYFGAEQVDAIALALDNMSRGAGFIIGDQTGIGKGRVVAAIIRHAIRQGRTPIFVTEKPNLYGDMYRDMMDIGLDEMLEREPKMLMTNAGQRVPLNDEGTKVLRSKAAASHNQLLRDIAAEGELGGYDVIFTTYSQMQTVKGARTVRQDFLEAMADGGIVIMDESHNAGGSEAGRDNKKNTELNRAEFARILTRKAHSVFHSSATYAKRPDVMDLYATTDMQLAVSDISGLGDAIQRGGVPMQQVVASMLSRSGQYLRRERSFDGVVYNSPVVDVSRKTYSDYSASLAAIQGFSETYIKKAVKAMDRQLKAEGKQFSGDGSTGGAGAASTNFTSIMHNLIDQMLLAIKADQAADRAIEAIKSGEKPVVTVANTMGSFLADFTEDMGIKPGDAINIDFGILLNRYLDRTRRITVRKPFMKKGEKGEHVYLTDEMLGPEGTAAFNAIRDQLDGYDFSALPVSPIDHIRRRLAEAGYSVGEITGRSHTIDYRRDGAYFANRPGSEVSIAGRRKAIADFNSGATDAMILNQAGSTGLSLHASTTFKDQRKRRMIIAQAEKNIDTHMQMLGRVHRTGQVIEPEYDQLVANVPAEKRPAAVLAKKMASLNANTTASRGGALTAEDVPDFMNEYGDEVAYHVMMDMPEIHGRLGDPVTSDTPQDSMRKVTGRIPLLTIEEQEMVYGLLESEYDALVEQKEAAGESILEAKTLALDARVIDSEQVVAPVSDVDSPFAEGVNVETLDVKVLRRPHPTKKVLEMVAETLGVDAGTLNPDQHHAITQKGREQGSERLRQLNEEIRVYRQATIDEVENPERRKVMEDKLDGQLTRIREFLRTAPIGQPIRLLTDEGNFYGVVTKIEPTGKTKNPAALGSWKVTFAMANSMRQLTIPLSQMVTRSTESLDRTGRLNIVEPAVTITNDMTVYQAFDRMQTDSREERTMITGNILSGFEHVGGKGAIVNFTDQNGDVRQGIMMPKDFDYKESRKDRPVQFRSVEQALIFLEAERGNYVESRDEAIVVSIKDGKVRFQVASSKKSGGKYYLDRGIREAAGGDFVKVGNMMRVDVERGPALRVLQEMKRAGAAFRAMDNLELARRIAGQTAPGSAPDPRLTRDDMKRALDQSEISDEDYSLRDPVVDKQEDIEAALRERMTEVGISDKIQLKLVAAIFSKSGKFVEGARGRFANFTIEIALDTRGKMWTLNHEVIHALRALGLINDAEWRVLSRRVLNDTALMDDIRQRYAHRTEEKQIEEAIADLHANYAAGMYKPRGFIRTAFQKISGFFEAVANAFRGNGFNSAYDVLEKISTGQVGRRTGEAVTLAGEEVFALRYPKKPAKTEEVTFDNEETELRWREARKGSRDQTTWLQRMKDRIIFIGQGFSRHFIDLPNTAEFSQAREQLRKIEAAPQASKEEVIRILRQITRGMNAADLDLFTRKVVLDDLMHEIDQQHDLPFGFTDASARAELAKIDKVLESRPDLQEKVEMRREISRRIANEMVEAGVLHADQIKNPAYYRHQVLEYARSQVAYAKGAGKRLKTPHWARRMGSKLDINANLLEAEFEWMQKALTNIAEARTIEWFKNSQYNQRAKTIENAKAHNDRLVDRLLQKDIQENGYKDSKGRDTSPLDREWRRFRQRIAFGLGQVRKALEAGLINRVPASLRDAAENIMDEAQGERSIFPLLAWILDNNHPGSMGAATAFTAINQRKAWVRHHLGEKYADPMNLESLVTKGFAPPGHVTWQPDEGNLLFTAKTIPEHVVDRLLQRVAEEGAGPISAEELMGALESVRSVLAVGGPKYQMILPEEVAKSMNSINDQHAEGLFDTLVATPLAWWKRWVLINPRRVLKYNLNNLSGDLDAVIAGNPKSLRHLPRAIKELYQVMIQGKEPSQRYREAVNRGVFDSGLTIQEIPDINYLSEFEDLVNKASLSRPGKTAMKPIMKIWRALQRYTWFRENWMRYAAYLDYVERLEGGESMESIGYGAGKREMVDAIEDNKDKAALLARELVGDYGAISDFGKDIRRKIIPFYSWLEINTKRYWRLGANAWSQGIGQGFKATGIIGASLGIRTTAYLTLRMAFLYAMVQLWNNLFFGDEEDELGAQSRARLHLIIGRNEDGSIRTLRFQGALSDFLDWFGLDDAVGMMSEIERGRADYGDLAIAMAKAPVNKIVGGLTPVITAPIELMSGQTYWPDVFRPRRIRDRWRHAARMFSLEHEYDLIFDRPSRGYVESLSQVATYTRDPGEMAYSTMKGMVFSWQRRERGQAGTGYSSERSDALYEWRLAMRYDDATAEREALQRLRDLGVDNDSLRASIRRAHPLGGLSSRDRAAFLQTLSPRERQRLEDAIRWYEETYLD